MADQIAELTKEIKKLTTSQNKAAEIEDSNSQTRDIFRDASAATDPLKKTELSLKLLNALPMLKEAVSATSSKGGVTKENETAALHYVCAMESSKDETEALHYVGRASKPAEEVSEL